MSDFYSLVYDLVARIPEGYVVTYGQIACALGKPHGARVVGSAMRCAPSGRHLPCHRVVNKAGEMAPNHVFGECALQRDMLEAEGVIFLPDGRIDMKLCTWTQLFP